MVLVYLPNNYGRRSHDDYCKSNFSDERKLLLTQPSMTEYVDIIQAHLPGLHHRPCCS